MSALGTPTTRPGIGLPAASGGEKGVHRAGLAPVEADLSEKTLPVRLLVDRLSGNESGDVHTLPALLRKAAPDARTDGVPPRRHGDDDGDILCQTDPQTTVQQPAKKLNIHQINQPIIHSSVCEFMTRPRVCRGSCYEQARSKGHDLRRKLKYIVQCLLMSLSFSSNRSVDATKQKLICLSRIWTKFLLKCVAISQ